MLLTFFKMNCVLIISVFALATAVSPPSNWPLEGLGIINDLRNPFLQGNRPVRQGQQIPRVTSGYSTNNDNSYGSIPPYARTNGVTAQQNIPLNNVQWIPLITTNNVNPFLSPPRKAQNDPEFQRALNNILNAQPNNLEIYPKKPYVQQKLAQTGFQASGSVDKKPPRSTPPYTNVVPPQNQFQYVTYPTPQSAPQINNQNINVQQPIQAAALNMKKVYPQVNNPNRKPPIIELDFNSNNPFSANPNKATQQNEIPRGPNGQLNGFGTVQPVINFGINFNTPYPQNNPPNQFAPQTPQPRSNPNPNRVNSAAPLSSLDFDPNHPFNKNYRDDLTHEPSPFEDPHYVRENTPPVERLEHEKAPVTAHDDPPQVPTRPIYPGEGKWAKFGVKHRPHISPHKFVKLEESKTVPDGYDTFLNGQDLFDFENSQFGKKLQEFPFKQQLQHAELNNPTIPQYQQQNDESAEEEESEEKGEDDFIATRLYAQVRQNEDEKHLPPESDENGRLKELVKDSKTHTIYSEEGYEDSAYDHAGHEKNAEKSEGFAKDKKAIEDSKTKTDDFEKKQKPELPQSETKAVQRESKEEAEITQITDDEFQKLKDEALHLDEEDDDDDNEDNEDSESEATEYDKSIVSKVRPPKKVYSARTKDASKYKMKMDDFIEAKDSSPISTIVKSDGNTEIEISSEVKVIVQPNNTTKSHKYVKIYPKYRKIVQDGDNTPIQTETSKKLDATQSSSTEIPFTTITPTIEEVFTVEIPATTQATTAIPKIKVHSQPKLIKRRKRDADQILEVEVDTDFIDKINHTLPDPPDKEQLIRARFPYYYDFKQIGLDQNSPLRYSEDLKKIPVKDDGDLAFYKQAEKKKECAEVNPIVDPVPDRIKKADKNPDEAKDGTEPGDVADSPRLTELGDKIDCFKARYFGENPFDNPIFEESIATVQPIFKDIDKIVKKPKLVRSSKSQTSTDKSKYKNTKRDLRNTETSTETDSVNDPKDYNDRNDNEDNPDDDYDAHLGNQSDYEREDERTIKSDATAKEIDNNYISGNNRNPKDDAETVDLNNLDAITESESEVSTLPSATLITTPKYTIDLKPKHIYDQIELLQYLPGEDTETTTTKATTEKPKDSSSNEKKKVNEVKTRTKKKKYYLDKTTAKGVESTDRDERVDTRKRPSDKTKIFERYSLFEDNPDDPPVRKSKENIGIGRSDDNLDNLSEKGTQTTLIYKSKDNDLKDLTDSLIGRKIRKQIKTYLDGTPSKAKAKGGHGRRRGKVLKDRKDNVDITISTEKAESLPEPEPLKRRRRLRKRSRFPFIFDINPYIPKIPVARPPFVDIILTPRTPTYFKVDIPEASYEIFDINKYLPDVAESKVSPQYKSMSEVYYKDDIKPDEQLNVFTDVFNNIKNYEDMNDAASEQVPVRVKPDVPYTKDKASIDEWKSLAIEPQNLRNIYKVYEHLDAENKTAHTKTEVSQDGTTTNRSEYIYNAPENHKVHDFQNPLPDDTTRMKPQYTNRIIKRRQKIQTTTKVPLEDKEEEDESTVVMGLVPPKPHGYKTIYNPKRDASSDFANEGVVEEKIINRFIVPGMKPPPKRRVSQYSDYLTVNHIPQNTVKSKRTKRSASRPAYAEVTRNKDIQPIVEKNETKADDDDYVPHRSQNYHYDEKTGKIVYDKKPQIEEESEEVEYIEVIEETPSSTTAKPKQNPIFATATPPPEGESYIDFVKLLKSASNYHEIPDPTTTEKGKEASTTEAAPTTTLKPVSTSPPEFLSILAKVRNDSNYKVIEDKNKTTTTTTVKPLEVIEDAEDGESQVQPVKNSPGSLGIVNNQMIKIFDITDFMPKPKNYFPKTSIDTSRYQSIQRPTLRHTLSSRYNSEEEKSLQDVNTSKKPLLNTDTEKTEEVKETSIEKVVSPTIATAIKQLRRGTPFTTTTTTTTTTSRPTQTAASVKVNRGNRRRLAARTTTTTQGDLTAAPTVLTRNRRTHRRRNPRVKVTTPTSTTTATQNLLSRGTDISKIIHRRSQRDSSTLSSENKVQILPEFRETESQNESPVKESSDENITDSDTTEVVNKVVDIFKNYDKIKKHGGNYREVNEAVANDNRLGQSQRSRVISQNDDVNVFKNYDKTKKHGGNYRAENPDRAQLVENPSEGNVEVFKDYDKAKKTGGNYRRENEGGDSQESAAEGTENEKTNTVETFKNYDKTKKHGGGYRSEDEVQHLSEPQYEESRVLTPKRNQIDASLEKTKDAEAFKTYDKTKKHGGNYKTEEDAKRKSSVQDKSKDIEIFNNYDKTKKHGGNDKAEDEGTIDPENEESTYDLDSEQKLQKRNNDRDPTVTDFKFKPDTFYTDPKLPVVINGLKIVDNLSHDELEEIVSSAEAGSDDELGDSSELERKDRLNVLEHGEKSAARYAQHMSTTTKKPLFIKDPSQRLYFYAPLR